MKLEEKAKGIQKAQDKLKKEGHKVAPIKEEKPAIWRLRIERSTAAPKW